jgi:hypothetical protein
MNDNTGKWQMMEHQEAIADVYRNAGFIVDANYQNGVSISLSTRKVTRMMALTVSDIEELPLFPEQFKRTGNHVFILLR